MKFDERTVTQVITPEFVRHKIGGPQDLSDKEAMERVEEAAEKLERSYRAVVEVEEGTINKGSHGAYSINRKTEGYTIRAIAARDAELDEIERGMNSILHWLGTERNDE